MLDLFSSYNSMTNLYSDGQGTFLYLDTCKDDPDFTNLKIEEEQADDSYSSLNINLHNSEIHKLIPTLKSISLYNNDKLTNLLMQLDTEIGSTINFNDNKDIVLHNMKAANLILIALKKELGVEF